MNHEILDPHAGPGTVRPAKRRAGTSLDHLFMARYTILRYERPRDFEKLLLELNASWEPGSRAEELTIFRMAQTCWMLRRIDLTETAVWDATAETEKQKHPGASDAGAVASFLLHRDNSTQIAFARRAAAFRALHEATLDRLTKQLIRIKDHRQCAELRKAKLHQIHHSMSRDTLSLGANPGESRFTRQVPAIEIEWSKNA